MTRTAAEAGYRALRRTARLGRHVLPAGVHRRLEAFARLGYVPDYEHPQTFNEKLGWLMLHLRDPRLPVLADKLAARDHVRRAAPSLVLPRIYEVADDADALAFDPDTLPPVSVLKSTHAYAQVRVLRQPIDVAIERAHARAWLASVHPNLRWEWHYGAIPPRVYVEEYLGDEAGTPPLDHKIWVFAGRATLVEVQARCPDGLRISLFDREWAPLPFTKLTGAGARARPLDATGRRPPPASLPAMLAAAEAVADDLPFVRVDVYDVRGDPYFGEITFNPGGGFAPFSDRSADLALGSLLPVPWRPGGGSAR